MSALTHFVSRYGLWFAAASAASVILGLILLPYFITRIPPDYFSRAHHGMSGAGRHPVVRAALVTAKNVLGAVLVVAGLVMLVLPGQGVLTLLIGLMIMDYPGKTALMRWVAGRPRVLRSLNWLRRRYGHPPLEPPRGGG